LIEAITSAARLCGWTSSAVTLADGGEGLLEAIGGTRCFTVVRGPLGEPVEAEWRLLGDASPVTAVVEMARASGALLVDPAVRDPERASTYGTGQLVAEAIDAGAQRVIVGCGGSATTDGGEGFLAALDDVGLLPLHIDTDAKAPVGVIGLKGVKDPVELIAACDVTTPFLEAARVFGPQKGATPEQVERLTLRLSQLVTRYRDRFGIDVTELAGAGAAGGLAGAIVVLGGAIAPGFDLVADLVGLDGELARADLVVTGEGRLDATSLAGKLVGGVIRRTPMTTPLLVVAGDLSGVRGSDLARLRLGDVPGGQVPSGQVPSGQVPSGQVPSGQVVGAVDVVSLAERFGLDRALGEPTKLVGQVVAQSLIQR